jgi:hypothetical protein
MIASSLLEAGAAGAITSIVLATLTATLGAAATNSLSAWSMVHSTLEERHREHLLEVAFERGRAAAGSISECSPEGVTILADLDRDGSIDTTSAEKTTFSVATHGGGKRVLSQRIGGQSMTLTDSLEAAAEIRCSDVTGSVASDASLVRSVEVPVANESTRILSCRFSP